MEVRKVCSGPPLELKEQAQPTDPLEPDEIDFGRIYLDAAQNAIAQLSDGHAEAMQALEVYLGPGGSKIPREAVDAFLAAAGCHTVSWDDIDESDWEDMGNGRQQGLLF